MKSTPITIAILLTGASIVASAQPALPPGTDRGEDPVHTELRMLRTNVVQAISSGDFDGTLDHLHTNAVITWQNNRVCRGHADLRSFFEEMGRDAFRGYQVPPTPDELTVLYGDDTGVSFGTTVAEYSLLGNPFRFTNRWTATLVKENGRWLLAGYHVSLNALDNPLLNAAKKGVLWAGIIGGGVGLLVGFAVGRISGKGKRA